MKKRGQFYIIAAVFISLILFGTASIATYTLVKAGPRTIYDLSSELDRETYKIIEFGVYNSENLTSIGDSFASDDFARYFLKKTTDANVIFVYGNKSNLQALYYQTANTGNIGIGGSNFEVFNSYSKKGKPNVSGNTAEVIILDKTYSFELKNNEIFYFVIVQKRGEEVFIERNKESKDDDNRPGKETNE